MYSLTKRVTIAFGRTAIRSSALPLAIASPAPAAPARTVQATQLSLLTTGRTLKYLLQPRNALRAVLRRAQIGRYKIERSIHFGRVVKVVEVDGSWVSSPGGSRLTHSDIQPTTSPGPSMAA